MGLERLLRGPRLSSLGPLAAFQPTGLSHFAAGPTNGAALDSQTRPDPRLVWRIRAVVAILVTFVAAIVVFVGVEAYELYHAYRQLEHGTATLRTSVDVLGRTPETWTAERIDSATVRESSARSEIEPAQSRISSDPILRALLLFPYASDQARTVFDLATAAVEADAADRDAIEVARDYQQSQASSVAEPGPTLIVVLVKAAAPLADADSKLSAATALLGRDSRRSLVPQLASQLSAALALLRPAASSAHAANQVAQLVPTALGSSAPQTYLLVLPNPSELRPTGGFSGVVGSVTMAQGRITDLTLQKDGTYIALYKEKFPPPGQEGTYLTFPPNGVGVGDAGWDPDFPTSAKLQEAMFKSATGVQVAGTVSFDPYLLSELLNVTGPVQVAPYGTFDAGNVFAKLNFLVNVPHVPNGGEQAVPPVAHAILAKLMAQPPSRWPQLAGALQQGIEQGHLQLTSNDPRLAAVLHAAHADGSLISTPLTEDYLMIAEANVAGDKADYYLKRNVDVKVEIYPTGINRHEVDIHYDYPPPVDATDIALNSPPYNPTSLYRDYVRFYLPLTATLSRIGYLEDGKPAPALGGGVQEQEVAHDRQVVGTFFVLHRGHSADLIIDYQVGLPADSPFRFYFEKQAGIPIVPFQLTVSYPGGIASRKADLVQDIEITIPW
jgi:hypothetical protein